MYLRVALLSVMLAALTPLPGVAAMEDPNRIFIENTSPYFVVGVPGEPEPEYSIEVIVSGSTPGRLEVSFQDTLQAGSSSPALPAGSTPSSLLNVLELLPIDLTYTAEEPTQRFLLEFRVKEGYAMRPFHGNLRIGFFPVSERTEGATNTMGVQKNLLITPYGWAGKTPDDNRTFSVIETNNVAAASRSGLVDGLIPDLPWLINRGPVVATTRVTNPGVYPNNTWIEWRFFDGEELLATKRIPTEFLRGGKSLEGSFLVTYTDDSTDRSFDVLPIFKIIRYEVTVQSELSGLQYEPQTETQHFLIAPWKEILVVLGVVIFAISSARKFRRRPEVEHGPTNHSAGP